MRSKKEQELLNALEEAALEHGYDLVDIERTGSGRNSLLRVYVDKTEGLTLDEVASSNAWISEAVEKLDPYKGSYTLEVSSPGIDRPLRTLAHFEQAIGKEAVITLDSALLCDSDANPPVVKGGKPRLKYSGVIVGVDPSALLIQLKADEVIYDLNYSSIKKARLKGRLVFENREDS